MKQYHDNVERYSSEIRRLDRESKNLSTLRLVVFLVSAFIIFIAVAESWGAGLLLVVPLCVLAFVYLVKRHNEVDYLRVQAGFLKEINIQEVSRTETKLSGLSTGETFNHRDHPYVSDLDIFGSHSLFQLLNRATTDAGRALLAEWLSTPASKDTILNRQHAVKELAPSLAWRQHFQSSGMHFPVPGSEFHKLLLWAEKPVQLPYRPSVYLLVIAPLSLLSTAAGIYFFSHVMTAVVMADIIPYLVPLAISLFVNALVLRTARSAAGEIAGNMDDPLKVLRGYQLLVTDIESREFKSVILQNAQSTFRERGYSASIEIDRLKKVFEFFQLRARKRGSGNLFYSVFNAFWFLDIYLILLTEKWKKKNGSRLRRWTSAVSEFEAVSSLAGFSHSNASFTFPEIKDSPCRIHFERIGHPLIRAEKRICNDFTLEGRGEIAMITGSNMAGKSTFLRTVGINVVLALMGAPVCATSAEVSLMKIFCSMRTQDNLEEGISSFYAELKRIEQLLKLIESGQPIFFLLDEMFKGTNSKDRHKGGFSLISQLKELNAFGIISTHDLDLAHLAGKHRIVNNLSFNSEIKQGEMTFSYRLTAGLCTDFNASELMKNSGIKILTDIGE